jgi:hypothetical protein
VKVFEEAEDWAGVGGRKGAKVDSLLMVQVVTASALSAGIESSMTGESLVLAHTVRNVALSCEENRLSVEVLSTRQGEG